MRKVCAVMPHYNQQEFMREAINSVRPQVDHLYFLDDGSRPYLTGEEVRYICCNARFLSFGENGGAAAAINGAVEVALDEAKEDGVEPAVWLTWVSADNTYEPGAFAALVNAAEEANAVAAYSGFWWEDPARAREYCFTRHTWRALISGEGCYYGPCFIIRADFWLPHRDGINHDYDNWLRVEEKVYEAGQKIVGLDRALCHYRAHPKRATVVKAHEYHADKIRAEAIERRTRLGLTALLP
jgi:glycosyltransferase involved in cell wall biosynthesis